MDVPFLSFQQKRILGEHEADLKLWQGPSLEDIWHMPDPVNKTSINKEYERVIGVIEKIRTSPIDYSTFNPCFDFSAAKNEIVKIQSPETIMGRCPCPKDGEETRCCNLKTLDAVQQCQFACAYCSIQSFYSHNQIRVVSDLKQKLETMALDKDTWHIGTGQSSDSLALSNDYGTLDALFGFAEKHKDIILELKTKSARTDWLNMNIPPNVISTWSVNAKTVIQKEEHLAASQDARINAAAQVAGKGNLIGFHIHPMVYFTDWQKEYGELVGKICNNVNPESVAMVGIGTLTFTKSNLRTLRQSLRPTRVTQMPLAPIAGKYSYDFETKKKMFSYVYNQFPSDWKEKVFFYLCMEDPALWDKCLNRSYSCNADFERDMKKHYFDKVLKVVNSKQSNYN